MSGRILIASYKRANVLVRMSVAGIFFIAMPTVTLLGYNGASTVEFLSKRPMLVPVFIISWFGSIFALAFIALTLNRVTLDGGRAIWIENGSVIYMHPLNVREKCQDILGVLPGTFGPSNSPGILLRMKNGREKFIPTHLLSEPQDVIIAKLSRAIQSATSELASARSERSAPERLSAS